MDFLLKKVFVGVPKTVGDKGAASVMDREWTSAIFKEPVEGPILVGKTGLTGNEVYDTKNHGGPEKAVFAYSLENYVYWRNELGNSEIGSGGMGENFFLENMTEDMVCIGDTYQIGDAVVQVSQPRQPCWKPARRYKIKTLALLIQNTGRTGWYFRVLKEGLVEEGQTLTLLERPYPQWTIKKCNEILHGKEPDFEEMRQLSECELLAPGMRETLGKRVAAKAIPDITGRVFGPNAEGQN